MIKNRTLILFVITLILMNSCLGHKDTDSGKSIRKPNIVYILADDLGYGDLGCYGQDKIETPNLDRMASQGILFTQHYAGCTVCAPSRSVLLTGKHTGHTYIRGNMEIQPEGQIPLADSVLTIAEVLKQNGYKTGAFGKWGLGMADTEGSPNRQGFDEFFGYLCQRYAHRYYPEYLWENDQKYFLNGNDWKHKSTFAPDVIQERVLNFIKENKDTTFFVYVPMVMPHAEIIAPEDSLAGLYQDRFEDQPWGYEGKDIRSTGNDYGSDNFKVAGYAPVQKPKATFAAMVGRLDYQVGEINELLERLGIVENTIVIFSSDNGPHQEGGADPDFFNSNGGLKGYKRDLYEGGIRVPMIVKWPSVIKQNSQTDHISAFWDIFPTLTDIADVSHSDEIDGISFLPTLTGQGEQKKHNSLYWEFHELGGRQALRKDDWKLVVYNVFDRKNQQVELYNLKNDPDEINNLVNDFPEKVKELTEILVNSRRPSPIFQFKIN